MAERRSIYTQVTELTNRIKQRPERADPVHASLCTQFVDNIVVDIRTSPVGRKCPLTWRNRNSPQNSPYL